MNIDRTLPVGAAALSGVVLGIGLELGTAWLAASGPTGEAWSFRGNGALVVPLGFGAAVLTGGWVAIGLYARGIPAWAGIAFALGCAAALPASLSILVLVLLGARAQTISDLLSVTAFFWPVFALFLATTLQLHPSRSVRLAAAPELLAGVLFAAALGAGFFGAAALLARGLA